MNAAYKQQVINVLGQLFSIYFDEYLSWKAKMSMLAAANHLGRQCI